MSNSPLPSPDTLWEVKVVSGVRVVSAKKQVSQNPKTISPGISNIFHEREAFFQIMKNKRLYYFSHNISTNKHFRFPVFQS